MTSSERERAVLEREVWTSAATDDRDHPRSKESISNALAKTGPAATGQQNTVMERSNRLRGVWGDDNKLVGLFNKLRPKSFTQSDWLGSRVYCESYVRYLFCLPLRQRRGGLYILSIYLLYVSRPMNARCDRLDAASISMLRGRSTTNK